MSPRADAPSNSLAFAPLQVGRVTLSSRVVLAPLTRLRAHDDHTPSELAVKYYAQRASYPGTLLIAEGTTVAHEAVGWANSPGAWDAKQIEGWKKIVDAVHARGSHLFLQLFAPGRAASAAVLKAENAEFEVVGPSAVAFEGGDVPRELTVEEIEQYVEWFKEGARAFVEDAGGDGVEIHAANGYLLDQFLQTNSNRRNDQYGGSVANRCCLTLDVLAAAAAAVGQDRVGLRLSPFADFQGMKMPPADIRETFTHLVREVRRRFPALAYLHLVEPRASGADDAVTLEGESLDFIANEWDGVVLSAGGHTAGDVGEVAERFGGKGAAVFGRHFISNPDLVARVKWGVPFRPYDRSTFYLAGPSQKEGYTTYPVEYGPDGKL